MIFSVERQEYRVSTSVCGAAGYTPAQPFGDFSGSFIGDRLLDLEFDRIWKQPRPQGRHTDRLSVNLHRPRYFGFDRYLRRRHSMDAGMTRVHTYFDLLEERYRGSPLD